MSQPALHVKQDQIIVKGLCYSDLMQRELDFPVDPIHKHEGISLSTKLEAIECTCRGEEENACRRILPVGINTTPVIVYNNCARTLYAAYRRQLKLVPKTDPIVGDKLRQFMDNYYNKYCDEHIKNFDYSYSQWYNSMVRSKQDSIDQINLADILKVKYGLFCKREKQEMGGKNRAISSICQCTKYVMGPVVWALEEVADVHFPGYCGKMSWEQLETFYEETYAAGFTHVVQGDGSGFDLTQNNSVKYIDRKIYSKIADYGKVHHVEGDVFKDVSNRLKRKMEAQLYTKTSGTLKQSTAMVDGTVFSGSSDTTMMNTLRMSIYIMFTMEQAGLEYGKDYVHKCKGDDFVIFTKELHDFDTMFYKYWCKPIKDANTYDYSPYGIGQILKFLKVSGYDGIDFCSTTVIPYGDGKFKIVRKPERVNPMSHYSRMALSMSSAELKQYYLDLADSMETSCGKIPYYNDYTIAFRHHASLITAEPIRRKNGKGRKIMPCDGHRQIGHNNDDKFDAYDQDFRRVVNERKSSRVVPNEVVLNYFNDKYHLTSFDLENHAKMLLKSEKQIFDYITGTINI